ALACGRPVVISDLPWARDELVSERHALLVPLEADAITEAVMRLLDESALARRLEHEARARALAELDLTASARRIDALYRSVVKAARYPSHAAIAEVVPRSRSSYREGPCSRAASSASCLRGPSARLERAASRCWSP